MLWLPKLEALVARLVNISSESRFHMKDKLTQIEKFKQIARELECDESERDFDEKLKRIVKPQDAPIKGKTSG